MSVKTLSPESPINSSSQQIVPIQIAITDDLQTIDLNAETVTDEADLETLPPNISQEEAITLRYDPEAIANFYRYRPLEVWSRRIGVVWIFVTFALSLWFDQKNGNVEKNQQKRAARLREILTLLGPAFIKVGQALSTRPDLVPPAYLEELAKLQDQLPPFPNEIAFQFIEEELGARPQEIYAELSDHPLAAASLGQVYRGKLKTGEEVAVKVQRPGLAEKIALDIYILRSLAMWANRHVKRIRSDLVAIMDEFGHRIYEEMDYAHEGRNAEKFDRLYGNLPEIYVPKIHWQYTGRRVLTMEWINGTKLTDLQAVQAQGIDAKHLIEVGVQCSLRQLLEHGFFHADPHPGNLLASPNGKLVYLDFGMMSEVRPHQRYGLLEAVVHLVNRDFEGLAKDYVKLEFLTPDTDLTPIIPALAGVFSDALGASVAELNFKSITDQLSEVMYEYPFRVPAYYALIIRSLVTLEGIAINVDPNFKVLSKAYPYVAKRLLTDPSPELRTSLKELLFKDGGFRWNRLENLLRNASSSDDYDISQVLNQALEFLFSQRGDFIRDRIVDELIDSIDHASRQAVANAKAVLGEWFGFQVSQPIMNNYPLLAGESSPADTVEHIKRIWQILESTPGFNSDDILQLLPSLLTKPEVQKMGQNVASGLTQRAIARFVRRFLVTPDFAPPHKNSHRVHSISNGKKIYSQNES